MSALTVLRAYAKHTDLYVLPPTTLLTNTSTTLTVFDKFPKAQFHFLVLPRLPQPDLSTHDLASLQNLLSSAKNRAAARSLVESLKRDGESAKEMIRDEMENRFGYTWDVWMGFHAVPSMQHIHLHVISSDLCSPSLKHKKHYNSFHPKLGFFLHIDEVLSWFDADPSFFDSMVAALKNGKQESLLKEALVCWRCHSEFKNIPQLKAHLQEEWDNEAKRERDKKRKRDEFMQGKKAAKTASTSSDQPAKRTEIEEQ